MDNITKDILIYLKNEHTKVESKEDLNGNYYSYVTDTIYIAKSFKDQKVPPSAKNINKKAAELVVVCHECIHSVQSKPMHILNMIFSNLSITLSVICAIIALAWTCPLCLKLTTGVIIINSIIIRLILEIGAVNGSTKLAAEIVSKEIVDEVSNQDIAESIKYIDKYKYLALTQMVADKIILLIIILILILLTK